MCAPRCGNRSRWSQCRKAASTWPRLIMQGSRTDKVQHSREVRETRRTQRPPGRDHTSGNSGARVADRWGTTPRDADTLTGWASRAAERLAARDPRVIEAEQHAEAARTAGEEMDKRHRSFSQCCALDADIFGAEQVRRYLLRYEFTRSDPEAANAGRAAAIARQEATTLRSLSVQDAAALLGSRPSARPQNGHGSPESPARASSTRPMICSARAVVAPAHTTTCRGCSELSPERQASAVDLEHDAEARRLHRRGTHPLRR